MDAGEVNRAAIMFAHLTNYVEERMAKRVAYEIWNGILGK